MKGKELKEIIKNSGIPIAQLAHDSGIIEGTLYSLYVKSNLEKEIPRHYLEKLKNTKLKFENNNPETNQNENPMILETMANALSKAVDALSEDNKHLREQNEYANELIRDYLKVNNQKAKSA